MANKVGSFFGSIARMVTKILIGGFLIIGMIMASSYILSSGNGQLPSPNSSFDTLYGDDTSDNMLLNVKIEGMILGTPPRIDPGPFSFLGTGGATYGYAIREILGRCGG